MKLVIIERGRFTVTAYVDTDSTGKDCIPVFDDMKGLGKRYAGSVKGAADLFKKYAEHGRLRPDGVTEEQLHHANYDPDIFQFIKGDVRIFCAIDEGMVVLINAGIKRGQRPNRKDVNKAIKVQRAYLDAKVKCMLEFMEKQRG
ncbi:hypothetical protein [Sedimenticola thiotaurini]|nr:hypothetical protein [Sedimenticola thiotaurini]